MPIGSKTGTIGKASAHVGPTIGKGSMRTGPIGRSRKRSGSALTLDQDRTKVAYPTTTTTSGQ